MKTAHTPQIVFAAVKVAELIGVTPYEFQKLYPDDFGVPGHWDTVATGGVIYTERGVAALVQALVDQGQTEKTAASSP